MKKSDPEEALFRAALERGIALFNQQKYVEAYEVWEERWNVEISEGVDLLQGLLQLAVALAKLSGGNPVGCLKLLDSARQKLLPFAPEAYELDVRALLEAIDAWRQSAESQLS